MDGKTLWIPLDPFGSMPQSHPKFSSPLSQIPDFIYSHFFPSLCLCQLWGLWGQCPALGSVPGSGVSGVSASCGVSAWLWGQCPALGSVPGFGVSGVSASFGVSARLWGLWGQCPALGSVPAPDALPGPIGSAGNTLSGPGLSLPAGRGRGQTRHGDRGTRGQAVPRLWRSRWHCPGRAWVGTQWGSAGAGRRQGDKVVMGTTDVAQPGPEAAVRRIQRLLKHQNYVAATAMNNIALLELEQPVECSDYIQLGCVPDSSLAVSELKTCYVAGWRATPENAPSPRLVLQEAKVRLIDVQLCNSSRWYGGAVHPQDLCAGYPRGGIDTCQGDIGGPLVCKDHAEENFWLVGLASWGRGCARARRPGIFTSTQHFHSWIRAHAGPSPTGPAPAPKATLNSPEPPGLHLPEPEPPEPDMEISFPKHTLKQFLRKLQEVLELLKHRTG
ncbi:unnamed protein product [Coccothraustes coccothraustes]